MKRFYNEYLIKILIRLKKAGVDITQYDFTKINDIDTSKLIFNKFILNNWDQEVESLEVQLDRFNYSVLNILDRFTKPLFLLKLSEYECKPSDKEYIDKLEATGEYNIDQLREIVKGRIAGSPFPSYYEDSKYDYKQMAYIREGISIGIDMKKYVEDGYNDDQLSAIFDILSEDYIYFGNHRRHMEYFYGGEIGWIKLEFTEDDYNKIFNHEYTGDQMRAITILMATNKHHRLHNEQLQITDREDINIDIFTEFIKMGFSDYQLDVLMDALEFVTIVKSMDISPLLNPSDYSSKQMTEILHGIKSNKDVSIYARPDLDADTMRIIRHNIDLFSTNSAKAYLFNNINAKQVDEIVQGIKDGVDVSIYAKPEYSADIMRYVRKALNQHYDYTQIINPLAIENGTYFHIYDNMVEGLPFEQYFIKDTPSKSVQKDILKSGFDFEDFTFDEE